MTSPRPETLPFYEELALAGMHDSPLRPGGLELTARAIAHCGFHAKSRLLDVGCGNGATVDYLGCHWGLSAVGVEPSPGLLHHGTRRESECLLVRAEGEHLPFPPDTWDGILLECVLSVTGDTGAVISECARVLKPGGHLIVTDVCLRGSAEQPASRKAPASCCVPGALDMTRFLLCLQERGFTVELQEDHSKALKEFAASLILAGIPWDPGRFCPTRAGEGRGPCSLGTSCPGPVKLGYFLLVARLGERETAGTPLSTARRL